LVFTREGKMGKLIKPKGLREILEGFFLTSDFQRRVREHKILELWKEVVGAGVSERTQPMHVRDGVLQVKVADSVWMNQLQFMKGMILQNYHEKLGSSLLRDLRFFIGEIDPSAITTTEKLKDPITQWTHLNNEERKQIEKEVAAIKDLETRQALSRLYAKGLIAHKRRLKNKANSG